MRRGLLIAITLMALAGRAHAGPTGADMREGMRLYEAGDYPGARDSYARAVEREPSSARAYFNHGAASYKTGDYARALDDFTRALGGDDPSIEPKAYYNIGNTRYRMGKALEGEDPEAASREYLEALEYYKKAIRQDADLEAARENLGFVKKEYARLQERMKREKGQQGDQGDRGDQDKQGAPRDSGQEGQDKDGQGNEQGQQGDRQDKGKDRDRSQAEGKDQAEGDRQDKGKDRAGGRPDEAGRGVQGEKIGAMTPEAARAMLDAYGAEERAGALIKQEGGVRRGQGVLKDW